MNNFEPDFDSQNRPTRRDVMFTMRVEGFVPTWEIPADPWAGMAEGIDNDMPF